jgi:hypothetical protein
MARCFTVRFTAAVEAPAFAAIRIAGQWVHFDLQAAGAKWSPG